jgi:membrane-associated protease RseP (regulator of RpoE activity)
VLFTLGVVVFALGLLLSIALHEIGHMVPAKRFGVKVTQYMVGFGPTLWSRKRGDTEYGLKAVPLGGYIRMIGMVPPAATGIASRWPRRLATSIEDFRRVSRAEIDPGDASREFYRLTPGKKMIVMLGGPSMNLLIYLVLTLILLTTLGMPHDDATTTVSAVSSCVVPANSPDAASDVCPAGAPIAPALHKLQPGDQIVSVDGTAIRNWNQLVAIIEPSAGKQLNMVVDRGGAATAVTITPVDNVKYVNDTGNATKTVGFLGIEPGEHKYFQTLGVAGTVGQVGSQIRTGIDAIGSYPNKIGNLWDTVFHGKPRSLNSPVGVVGIGRLGGDLTATHQLDGEQKLYTMIGLLASVNLLLFFFNLLPLLPLDGGHVAGALVEAVKRGRARLRARRVPTVVGGDPEARPQIFVDTAQMLPVVYAVASVLVLLTLLTLYADIVKPIKPFGG